MSMLRSGQVEPDLHPFLRSRSRFKIALRCVGKPKLQFGRARAITITGPESETAMAKGQMRGNKEKKKPKAEWNKKKKVGPAPSPFGAGITYKSAYTLQGKKGS